MTDDDLDRMQTCLPDCVEIYGPYRPRHAPDCRHDDIGLLVAEVRRLRDGIRREIARQQAVVDEARDGGPEDPAVWARHFAASRTATSLRALLEDEEDNDG